MKKKILSLVLVAIMCLSVLPMVASAAENSSSSYKLTVELFNRLIDDAEAINLFYLDINNAYPEPDNPGELHKVAEFGKELTVGIDDNYEKAKVIMKWFDDNFSYAEGTINRAEKSLSDNIYEDFLNRKGDCWVYSILFRLMMVGAGIPTDTVSSASRNNNEGSHAWNMFWYEKEARWVLVEPQDGRRFDHSIERFTIDSMYHVRNVLDIASPPDYYNNESALNGQLVALYRGEKLTSVVIDLSAVGEWNDVAAITLTDMNEAIKSFRETWGVIDPKRMKGDNPDFKYTFTEDGWVVVNEGGSDGGTLIWRSYKGKIYLRLSPIAMSAHDFWTEIKIVNIAGESFLFLPWGAADWETGKVNVRAHIVFQKATNGSTPSPTTPVPNAPNINTASSWAVECINSAVAKGFVPADLQNNYTAVITRQEFCRMAVKWVEAATGKNIDTVLAEKGVSRNNNAFTDTTNPDILAAFALGITSGTGPGTFTPNGEFSRKQAATMIRNTCRVVGMDVSNVSNQGFTDISAASDWARDGINFVRANGIMQGTSSNPPLFSPKGTYTREQSIITFNNIKAEISSNIVTGGQNTTQPQTLVQPQAPTLPPPPTGEVWVVVNGKVLDQTGVNQDGRTLLPFNAIAEALGMAIDPPAGAVGDNKLVTMLVIVESFGASVDWNGDTQTVTITK